MSIGSMGTVLFDPFLFKKTQNRPPVFKEPVPVTNKKNLCYLQRL